MYNFKDLADKLATATFEVTGYIVLSGDGENHSLNAAYAFNNRQDAEDYKEAFESDPSNGEFATANIIEIKRDVTVNFKPDLDGWVSDMEALADMAAIDADRLTSIAKNMLVGVKIED